MRLPFGAFRLYSSDALQFTFLHCLRHLHMHGVARLLQYLACRLQLLRCCFLKLQSLLHIFQLMPNHFHLLIFGLNVLQSLHVQFLQPLHLCSSVQRFSLLRLGLSQLAILCFEPFHLRSHSFQFCPCCFQSRHWCSRSRSPFVSWRLRFPNRPPNMELCETNKH